MLDFIRIACAVPAVRVGDTAKNAEDICAYIEKADGRAGGYRPVPGAGAYRVFLSGFVLSGRPLDGSSAGNPKNCRLHERLTPT